MENTETPRDRAVLERRVELDASADVVWDLIARPERLAEWLADDVDVEIVPGATGTIVDDGAARFVHVDRVEHGRSVAFTWWEHDRPGFVSQVELRVVPSTDGASALEIVETMRLPSASMSASTSATAADLRWETRVGLLWACTAVAALVPAHLS
jgi:uncharacterized protein YndB with AHSA1/START domain